MEGKKEFMGHRDKASLIIGLTALCVPYHSKESLWTVYFSYSSSQCKFEDYPG